MKRFGIPLLGLVAVGCTPETEQKSTENQPPAETPAAQGAVYCGGETSQRVVDDYFEELNRGLSEDREPAWFNRFVAERFSSKRDDQYLVFDRDDFVSATPRFFSMDDWREIAARGPDRLEDVGYRGCMFDHGKIWFEGDGEYFRLRAINHDMPWVEAD